MKPFTSISSIAIPLPRKDIDTDLIIPAQYLTSISRAGYGENLFRRLRDQEPDFPLNLPRYRGASILIAGANFGCGSSREHAVWALQGWGIKVVIAESFADIFAGNSAKNGLLLVQLPAAAIAQLLQAADQPLTVDLEQQQVMLPNGTTLPFQYDPFRRHCLLNGLDDIDYLLSCHAEIAAFRAAQEGKRFFVTTEPNHRDDI